MRRNAVRLAVPALAALVMFAQQATAQGYGVYEHDACAMGRAGTGVAKPCNASAIFYNPAGLVDTAGTRWKLAAGATIIRPSFSFTDSATGNATAGPVNNILVPNVYLTRQFANGWAGGIGVFVPYGLKSEWPSTSAMRFLGYRSELKSIYIQPTVSKRVNNWLQIGAGFDYIHTSVDLKQHVDLSSQVLPTSPATPAGTTFGNLGVPLGTDFADAHLTGGANSAAWHFGVLLTPNRRVAIGIRYLTKSTADIQGDATFAPLSTNITLAAGNPFSCSVNGTAFGPGACPGGTPLDTVVAPQFRTGGALVKQHASTLVPLPDQLVAGIAVTVTNALTILGDYQWTNWHRFSKLPLTFLNLGVRTLWEDYSSTSGFRLGAQYDVNAKVSVRGGLLYHQAAAPDNTVTPLLPEGARAEQTLGVGFQLTPRARLEAAYQHITQEDRRGRVVDAARGTGATLNSGLYTGGANLFGASLTWGF
jgi:long-chain fatty acid transport protein